MNEPDEIGKIVAPWFGAADCLERWHFEQEASHADRAEAHRPREALRRMRDTLLALARGEVAIPAETPGDPSPGNFFGLSLHETRMRSRDSRPVGLNEIRLRRDAILRLSVWSTLSALRSHTNSSGHSGRALADLQTWIGSGVVDVPPGMGPSLPYAGSESALAFFNTQLRGALHKLADAYDQFGADFGSLARAQPFDDSGVAVSQWSRAWTAAIAAVYLDWLTHRSAGSLDRALLDLWGTATGTVRFKAPAGLAVLPTRERSMHIDLWTGVVHAQVLAHDPARWRDDPAAGPWHRLRIGMHDLGEKDGPRSSAKGVRTVYRGLGVEMLYQVVFVDCATALLQLQRDQESTMKIGDRTVAAQTIVVEIEAPSTGQHPNVQLVLRWKDRPPRDSQPRFSRALKGLELDPRQRQALAAWRWRRAGNDVTANPLDAVLVDWRTATVADRFDDENGSVLIALGHAALWGAVSPHCEWMELALQVRLGDRWQGLPVCVHDESIGGELRSWLLLELADPPQPGLDVERLRSALASPDCSCWVANPAGLGVFVMGAIDLDRNV